jgi:hypothetical protein
MTAPTIAESPEFLEIRFSSLRHLSCGNAPAKRARRAQEAVRFVTLKHQLVHFRICDVYYPEVEKVLSELHGNDLLQGRVIDISDAGGASQAFVVVEVEGVSQPIVIPTGCILGVL